MFLDRVTIYTNLLGSLDANNFLRVLLEKSASLLDGCLDVHGLCEPSPRCMRVLSTESTKRPDRLTE